MADLSGARSAEYTETIGDGETGETIFVHPVNSPSNNVTCTVITSGNTGKFQFTTSGRAAVIAGTATWQDWSTGDVTSTTTDVLLGAVTALRGVSVSGEIDIEVCF